MPNTFQDFLLGQSRARATAVYARFDGYTADGSGDALVTLTDTGVQVRAGVGLPNVTLAPLQTVILTRGDGSGRSMNTGYVVTGFPPSALRNASNLAPTSATKTNTGSTVTFISPSSITFIRPVPRTGPPWLPLIGPITQVDIYGVGLDLAQITYGTDVGNAPETLGPFVTPTHVILQLSTSPTARLGSSDFVIGTQRFVRYFTIST